MQRLGRSVARSLANATAVWQGREPGFGVVFEREPHDALSLAAGYSPTCSFCIANAPGLEQGGVLVIDGNAFQVTEPVEPDAAGWVTLQLREAEQTGGEHG